jgi:hypothetical protein
MGFKGFFTPFDKQIRHFKTIPAVEYGTQIDRTLQPLQIVPLGHRRLVSEVIVQDAT